MKTRILLGTISAAALAVITLNLSAANALLPPRAAGNQIKIVPATAADQQLAAQPQGGTVSPRTFNNRPKTVAGVLDDVNPFLSCRAMTSSPRVIQACAENPHMPQCRMRVNCTTR